MRKFLVEQSQVELSRDYLVQELWQGVLADSKKLEESYSLQYFEYGLDPDLIGEASFLEQKIQEYGRKFCHSLDEVYKEYDILEEINIPYDVIYDDEKQSIFIYFLIPYQFADIFSSEEEWSFSPSEMPANDNIKTHVKSQVDGVLE